MITSKDTLKDFKKELTKRQNAFNKKAVQFFSKKRKELDKKTLDEVVNDEYYNVLTKEQIGEYGNSTDFGKAYFKLFSYTEYCFPNRFKNAEEFRASIELIKGTKLYPYAKELFEELNPIAQEWIADYNYFEKRREIITQITEIQRAINTLKSKENQDKIDSYIRSLENWKPAEIIEGNIYVNGNNVGKEAIVGMKIGTGKRVHIMKICIRKDEETKEDVIGVWNDTRWRQSDLAIIDIEDKIPDEVISLIK